MEIGELKSKIEK